VSLLFKSLEVTFQLTSGCHCGGPIRFDACTTIHTSLVLLNHLYLTVFKYLPKFILSLLVHHNIVLWAYFCTCCRGYFASDEKKRWFYFEEWKWRKEELMIGNLNMCSGEENNKETTSRILLYSTLDLNW
jgi:hypothetical protein